MNRIGPLHSTRATAQECAAREAEGGAFQAWREGAGISRASCAKTLGVNVATLRRWEEGLAPIPAARREQMQDMRRAS